MIAFLEGTLVSGGTEAVVSVGGGIGLDVHLSALAADRLPAPGEAVRLWTHLAVREDAWTLYGFLDPDERAMFRLLITVSGVGPKVALGMLSRAPADAIARYLRTGDEKALSGLPGIGKKSAARLVVELGQRVPAAAGVEDDGGASSPAARSELGEAMAVLGAMGLPPSQAEQALLKARQGEPDKCKDIEAWVRTALRHLR
jgi:Holliday junction DNA helicase RuvA